MTGRTQADFVGFSEPGFPKCGVAGAVVGSDASNYSRYIPILKNGGTPPTNSLNSKPTTRKLAKQVYGYHTVRFAGLIKSNLADGLRIVEDNEYFS